MKQETINALLEQLHIENNNIARLLGFIDKPGALEVLLGTDDKPSFVEGGSIKIYGVEHFNISNIEYNPIYNKITCVGQKYNTIYLQHPFTDETDIQLLRDKVSKMTWDEASNYRKSSTGSQQGHFTFAGMKRIPIKLTFSLEEFKKNYSSISKPS